MRLELLRGFPPGPNTKVSVISRLQWRNDATTDRHDAATNWLYDEWAAATNVHAAAWLHVRHATATATAWLQVLMTEFIRGFFVVIL